MREIVYKNLVRNDNKRRDLCIREIITRDDFMATIERRCLYFVHKKVYLEDPSDLKKLEALKTDDNVWKKKHFHILREHDSDTGEDKLICKVAGTFYAIVNHYVFCIAFVHSFKIDMTQEPVDEK
jgi:hypothetical protein